MPPDTYAFSLDGSVWNYADIIEFALAWSDDWTSNVEPHFTLSGDTALITYLGTMVPEGIPADDRSILSLLRALIDQRRGMDARLSSFGVDTDGFPTGDIEVHLYSTNRRCPFRRAGRTLPANPNQIDVAIAGDLDEQTTVELDKAQLYDEIRRAGRADGGVPDGCGAECHVGRRAKRGSIVSIRVSGLTSHLHGQKHALRRLRLRTRQHGHCPSTSGCSGDSNSLAINVHRRRVRWNRVQLAIHNSTR